MPSIYVAGPVIRGFLHHLAPGVANIYRAIFQAAEYRNARANLPEATLEMELANAEQFFERISYEIQSSDVAITIFTGRDVSAACEATLASFHNKKQLFIVEDQDNVPRLLRGLPGVVDVASAKEPEVLSMRIVEFLNHYLSDDEPHTMAKGSPG